MSETVEKTENEAVAGRRERDWFKIDLSYLHQMWRSFREENPELWTFYFRVVPGLAVLVLVALVLDKTGW